jgi:hypothetical protein
MHYKKKTSRGLYIPKSPYAAYRIRVFNKYRRSAEHLFRFLALVLLMPVLSVSPCNMGAGANKNRIILQRQRTPNTNTY